MIERMATTWETIEERERRVRGTRTTSVLARAADQIPGGDNLKTAFSERPFISREELRHIIRDHDEGPVITLYLNFSGERLVRDHPLFLTVFDSLRHGELDARKPYIESLPHAQRLRVPEDLAEVHAFLDGFQPAGARALVIFKQGARLNRVMPLPVRVADSLTIDVDPYIQPLEAILEEQRRVLVVDLSKEKASVSLYELGYEESLASIKALEPSDSDDASRPGNGQGRRLTHLQWHLKSSALLADRLFREKGADLVALIGEERRGLEVPLEVGQPAALYLSRSRGVDAAARLERLDGRERLFVAELVKRHGGAFFREIDDEHSTLLLEDRLQRLDVGIDIDRQRVGDPDRERHHPVQPGTLLEDDNRAGSLWLESFEKRVHVGEVLGDTQALRMGQRFDIRLACFELAVAETVEDGEEQRVVADQPLAGEVQVERDDRTLIVITGDVA